jgi:hypothetical protein
VGGGIVTASLGAGVLGYHELAGLRWIDALLNAAMILTGMGPVDALTTTRGKLFAACYALFSGIAFLSVVAVVFAPVVQRFLHRFHLEAFAYSGGQTTSEASVDAPMRQETDDRVT